jgi:(2R)-3-sulfolactate dehydrogenase (NADP+)
MPWLTSSELTVLAQRALEGAGASRAAAAATAEALVAMDEQGLESHGVARVPQYAGHLKSRRIDGQAEPRVASERGAALLVDAADGLAYPACTLAVAEAVARARAFGVAWAGVTNSHHCGAVSYHLRPAGAANLVGLAFSNSPAAMPAWQGRRPVFGTNPIAAVFPRKNELPIVVDLSLSVVARGKLLIAASEGKPIPPDWAVDREGRPTTDPKAGLQGMMLPVGGVKGTMLALVVELLCTALTGARLGFEADSFFGSDGNRPRIGQAFLVIDPSALAGLDVYFERVETLLTMMLQDPEVRIPGYRREWLAEEARREGIEIGDALLEQLRALGSSGNVNTARY